MGITTEEIIERAAKHPSDFKKIIIEETGCYEVTLSQVNSMEIDTRQFYTNIFYTKKIYDAYNNAVAYVDEAAALWNNFLFNKFCHTYIIVINDKTNEVRVSACLNKQFPI